MNLYVNGKMGKKLLCLLSTLALFSCVSREALAPVQTPLQSGPEAPSAEDPQEEVPVVHYESAFSAQLDPSGVTRANFDALDGNKVKWETDDEIYLTNGSTSKSYFVEEGGDTYAKLYFSSGEDLSGDAFYAVYPAGGGSWASDVYSVTIPTTQTCTAGNFDPEAFPMVGACGSPKSIQFKNVGAVLSLTLSSGLPAASVITSVVLSANEALAGACSVEWDGSTAPSVTCKGSTSVTLDCGTGVAWGTPLYVCVAPGTYTDFCVTVNYTGSTGSAHYTWRKDLSVARSGLKHLYVDFTDVVAYTDLGASETANCYLITDNAGGYYRFPVTVKGNGVGTTYCTDKGFSTKVSPKDIKELYTYYHIGIGACASASFLEGPELIGDYICFRTKAISAGTISGNSCTATDAGYTAIAVSSNEDWASDLGMQALWSWTIWYNPVVRPHNLTYDSHTYYYHNINLGGTATGYSVANYSTGCYFQWGRKDPFQAGYADLASPFVNCATDATGTLAKVVADPHAFYGFVSGSVYDWDQGEGTIYYDWWNKNQNSSAQTGLAIAKTMFDPCPPGYHVMSWEAMNALLNQATKNYSGSSLGFGAGWVVTFPGAGSRRPNLADNGLRVNAWTTRGESSSGHGTCRVLWASAKEMPTTGSHTSYARGIAAPVRCQRAE